MNKWLLLMLLFCAQVAGAEPFATEQWQTSNGARVIFYPAMEVPMLDISIAFAAGSAYDGEAFGLSALTLSMLNQGNNGMTAATLAEKLAETGAQLEAAGGKDMVVLNLKTLTRQDELKKASELFTVILTHPDFPQDAFQREKSQQLMALVQAQDTPDEVANLTFFQMLYQHHPYAHLGLGNQETVNKISLDEVRDFYKKYFVANNAIIVLVGAIDKHQAEQLAERLTNELPAGQKAPDIPLASELSEDMNVEVPFPSSQTVIRLGQLGITHHDKRYFPLIVGNYILGGGSLISELGTELREKRGLTYGAYSQFSPMPGRGPFMISLSTKKNQAKTALEITRNTLASFIKNGPSEQELRAAKQYLTGSFPLSLASNRSIADILLKIAFYHLPEDYLQNYISRINAVTREDIRQAFQQLIIPNKLLQVTVGK